ncbi:unnamed protein product [Effrenium voratum]|nr:unnamed protein product [Effrenium voratum]
MLARVLLFATISLAAAGNCKDKVCTQGPHLLQTRSAVDQHQHEGLNTEQPEELLECDLSVVEMDFETGPDRQEVTCHAPGGDLELDLRGARGFKALTGDKATVRGYREGRRKLRVNSFEVRPGRGRGRGHGPKGPNSPSLLQSTGVRTAAVLMIRWLDAAGNLIPSAMDTAAERQSFAVGVNNSLYGDFDSSVRKTHASTWKECSYGQLELDFDVDGAANDLDQDISGEGADIFYADIPITCDTATDALCPSNYDAANSCTGTEYYGWPRYAFNLFAQTKPGFSRSNWQHWILIFPRDVINCNFIGLGNVGCSSSYCYSWIPTDYSAKHQDYTHELGHNLGMGHAGVEGGNQYADYSCAMGYCCSVRCYNAPHAYELGWMTPLMELTAANFVAPLTGVALRSMSLYEDPVSDVARLGGHGRKTRHGVTEVVGPVVFQKDGTISITTDWVATVTTYWIQLKTAHAYDKFMNSAWLNNVQIKKWNKGDYEGTWHMATLAAGQSWTSPDGEVTVTVDSIDTTSAMTAMLSLTRANLPTTTVATTTTRHRHVLQPFGGRWHYLLQRRRLRCVQLLSWAVRGDGHEHRLLRELHVRSGGGLHLECYRVGLFWEHDYFPIHLQSFVHSSHSQGTSCPSDCASQTGGGAVCGNGVCEAGNGETCRTCPADCAGRRNGRRRNRFCCGDSRTACSDSRCSANSLSCTMSEVVTETSCCGDGVCTAGLESSGTCSIDC